VSGIELPRGHRSDGVDLVPYLAGRTEGTLHPVLFWRMQKRKALRCGEWKLVQQPNRREANAGWELYHLSDDIGESRNLAADNPVQLAELVSIWQRLNDEMENPFWTPRR